LKIHALVALGALFFTAPANPCTVPVLASGGVAPNVKAVFRPNTFGECKMWLTVIQRERFEANLRYLARIRPHNVQPIIDNAYAPLLTNAKHNLTEKLNEFTPSSAGIQCPYGAANTWK
jgi:hypothetical protein